MNQLNFPRLEGEGFPPPPKETRICKLCGFGYNTAQENSLLQKRVTASPFRFQEGLLEAER